MIIPLRGVWEAGVMVMMVVVVVAVEAEVGVNSGRGVGGATWQDPRALPPHRALMPAGDV